MAVQNVEDVHLTTRNQTGKLLSPRKILMDTRDRITEISRNKRKGINDEKSLLGDYISPEELWHVPPVIALY